MPPKKKAVSKKKEENFLSRAWCFTINNYTQADISRVLALESEEPQFLIAGFEVGKCGTPHIQGFVHWQLQKSFSRMKKYLPRAHLEVAKGTDAHNDKYCKKDDELLIRFGEPCKQGRRSDIDYIREHLRQGANMRFASENARSTQSLRMAEIWLKYHEKRRDWKPEVRWYHGSTGTGKTKAAVEWLGEDYYKPLNFKWWEGYDAHENVLLDEIRGDFCKYHEMLQLLDRYQYRVECKGGSRQLLAKKIAITSPFSPSEIWPTREDKQQLFRRIDEVVLVGEKVSVYELLSDNEVDFIDP